MKLIHFPFFSSRWQSIDAYVSYSQRTNRKNITKMKCTAMKLVHAFIHP